MKTVKVLISGLFFCLAGSVLGGPKLFAKEKFSVSSNDIKAGSKIGEDFVFNGMGCSGKNLSPEIHWSNAPAGTKSFAVTVYDPDAPTGSGFWHWVAYNIPLTVASLAKGAEAAPNAFTNAATDFGSPQYGGPCPPAGKSHRYVFTVHALKVEKIQPPEGATNAFVRFLIEADTLEKTKFTATYGK